MWKEGKAKCTQRECDVWFLRNEAGEERLEMKGMWIWWSQKRMMHKLQAQSKLNSRRPSQLQNISTGTAWLHPSSQTLEPIFQIFPGLKGPEESMGQICPS